MRFDRTTIAEICRTIRTGMTNWGTTLRLCVIITVLAAGTCAVILSMAR